MAEPTDATRPTWPLGVVLAAAGLLAWAMTRQAVHIAPSPWVLTGAAVLVTGALCIAERWSRIAALASAAVAGLAAAHVLMRPGMPQVHDPDHVWGLWAYARAVHAGHPLPMWMPDLGAGMPLLRFYGPASFVLALPGVAAGLAPVGLWKEAMLQAAVLSALAALFGARLLGAGWRAALVAACALAFAPWRLTVENLRGALGESTAMIAAPLVAAAMLAMLRAPTRRAAWTLGIATAVLIPTHLITLFCLAITLVPAALADEIAHRGERAPERPAWRRWSLAAAPVVLAAGVAAVWWLPAVLEGKATSLPLQTETHGYFIYDQHGLTASDLLTRRAWDTQRSSLLLSARAGGMEGKQMPFYVGFVLFGAAVTAPWWSRSRRTWGPACGAAAALIAASAPAAALMTHLPAFHKIQFPWRFLTAGSILAALAIGLGVSALDWAGGWRRSLAVLALPALLVADAAPYTGACGWVAPYSGVMHWVRVEGAAADAPFDVAMRAAPQDWSGASGLMRVGGLYLPPDDLTTPVALFWIPYVEWTTPAIYRGFLHARGPRDFAEAGVSRFFLEKRDRPSPVDGKPYATLERGESFIDAGPFRREPGEISLRPVVPEGGGRLVIREQAFPGWVARVDGRDAPIASTPLGFMAIDLAAGTHEVTLEFTQRTPARRAGWAVTLISLVAMGLGARRFRGQSPFSFKSH